MGNPLVTPGIRKFVFLERLIALKTQLKPTIQVSEPKSMPQRKNLTFSEMQIYIPQIFVL